MCKYFKSEFPQTLNEGGGFCFWTEVQSTKTTVLYFTSKAALSSISLFWCDLVFMIWTYFQLMDLFWLHRFRAQDCEDNTCSFVWECLLQTVWRTNVKPETYLKDKHFCLSKSFSNLWRNNWSISVLREILTAIV